VQFKICESLYKLDRCKEALMQLDDRDFEGLFLKGKCLDRQHKWAKALEAFESAL
jgi:hypothetical protein